MRRVIDVSAWQQNIDWNKVKASGKVDAVMLRAGYGRNNIDNQFHRNARELTRLGIPFGVYWFSYALNVEMARQEARYCMAACVPYNLTYPICYDLEYDTINYAQKNGVYIGKTLATQMANAFCEEIKKAGKKPMNYTNLDYLRNMFGTVPHDTWFAQYGPANPSVPLSDIEMWQYSSSGSVPGVPGRVDMNYCYKDYEKKEEKPIVAGKEIAITTSGMTTTRDTKLFTDAGGKDTGNVIKKGKAIKPFARKWYNGICYFAIYGQGWVSGKDLTGWIKESGKWWFLLDGYKFPKSAWKTINKEKYYFNKNGWMLADALVRVDGKVYYVDKSGKLCYTDETGALK